MPIEFEPTRDFGDLTYRCDSNNNSDSPNFSLKLKYNPDIDSVTLGSGYYLRFKSSEEFKDDMSFIGLDIESTKLLSQASSLQGSNAKTFVALNHNKILITHDQLNMLFARQINKALDNLEQILLKHGINIAKIPTRNPNRFDFDKSIQRNADNTMFIQIPSRLRSKNLRHS